MFDGKIHYKWSFSIAMLNYQRVVIENFPFIVALSIKNGDFPVRKL